MADPRLDQIPEHLRTLVPYLLDNLQAGPQDARWLGWAHSGLEVIAEAGLISIDPRMERDDPFVVRLPGDRRDWRGWHNRA